jgi:sulfonate transport system ATP-binding protein
MIGGAVSHDDRTAAITTTAIGLEVNGISRAFGSRVVLQDLDLHVAPGEFVGIVGKSGCGKSTLLRLIAGLDRPDRGEIRIGGAPLAGLTDQARFMFQEPRLLPWKRVRDNVALGLPRADAAARAQEALSQVGLGDRGGDWPGILSGGQRQRVALARALASHPPLLLLDEPLGALDALTRLEMQALIERLQAEHGFTALLVTHDIEEAISLCDRVILLEAGRIAIQVPVPLPRPRVRSTTAFVTMKEELLSRLLAHPPSFEI